MFTCQKILIKKKVIGILASGRVGKNYKDFTKKISNEYLSSILDNYISKDLMTFSEIPRNTLNTKTKNHIAYID